MADENARNQNQEHTEDKGKAMGAGASGNYQGQQGQQDFTRKPNETAGQGGGIQGTGQSQANPGGHTQGGDQLRDEGPNGKNFSEEKKERE